MSQSAPIDSGPSSAASASRPPAGKPSVVDLEVAASLADRLKDATAEQHRRAETGGLMQSLAGGTIEPVAYRTWIAAMHALHGGLQTAIEIAAEAEAGRNPARAAAMVQLTADHRRHLRHLESDMAALAAPADAGADTGRPEFAFAAPVAAELAAAATAHPITILGSLYVLEGSMNGNSFIARRLGGVWGSEVGLAYLQSDGADQRPNWMQWRADLDAVAMSDAERDATVEAAGRMFDIVGELGAEVEAIVANG